MLLLLQRVRPAGALRRRYPSQTNDLLVRTISSASPLGNAKRASDEHITRVDAVGGGVPVRPPVGMERLNLYKAHRDLLLDASAAGRYSQAHAHARGSSARLDERCRPVKGRLYDARMLAPIEDDEKHSASSAKPAPEDVLLKHNMLLVPSDRSFQSEMPPTSHAQAWRAISDTSIRRPGHSFTRRGRFETSGYRAYAAQQNQRLFSTKTGKRQGKPPSPRLGTTKVPTPPSPPEQKNALVSALKTSPTVMVQKATKMTFSIVKTVLGFFIRLPGNLWFYITHPVDRKERIASLKQAAKDEVHHYWVGTKLLWADTQTARNLLGKTLEGDTLTRRERKQLLRTVSDLFRLVPFSMFLIIPFMEFALPFALRIFPNMLPSTFQDSLKAEENMKRELKSRIAMAQFFQETMEELAKEQKRKAAKRKKELAEAGVDLGEDDSKNIDGQEASAASMLEFLEKARSGEIIPPDVIIRYANLFQDDLTLDNMPRMQLINMCKYMAIPPYGSEAFLRFQLRHRIRVLKEDDQRILWEGIDSLTKMELREACQERGMRSTGLSKDAYRRSLQQWLDLSVNKNVPISLLVMSRTFFLREEMLERKTDDASKSVAGLADAISGLDKEVLDQVILEVATSQEKISDPEIRKLKLEVVSQQNELIRQEQAARDAAAKKKGSTEKESSGSPPLEEGAIDLAAPLEGAGVSTYASSTIPGEGEPTTELVADTKKENGESDETLSTEEMDALSQLVSEDPVSKERAELERIKTAMKAEASEHEAGEDELTTAMKAEVLSVAQPVGDTTSASEPMTSEEAERMVDDTIERLDQQVEAAAAETQIIDVPSNEEEEEEIEDPVVARLKKRIESMVDKIEIQLSDAEVKIGDKLHFLDKDSDGILTREEMAEVLQQVMKRDITHEEAMEIANTMDENHDGIFTVDELLLWLNEQKLVKFVEEGKDADLDRIMESQASSESKTDDASPTRIKTESK